MLDDKRRGEIALAFVRYRFKREGVRIFPDKLKRELGNAAKAMAVPLDELSEFTEEEIRRFMDETFNKLRK